MSEFYSQRGEDAYLHRRFLSRSNSIPKTYLEIGAVDGVLQSNTKFLEDTMGWTGVLVEPNPVAFESLRKNRSANVLMNSLVSSSSSPVDYLYFENEKLAPVSCVASTMTERNRAQFYQNDADWLVKAREKNLKQSALTPIKMDAVIESSGLKSIGVCIIDVEGHEYEVLRSFSFSTEVSIFMIDHNPYDDKIAKYLAKAGYHLFASPANNNVFLSPSFRNEMQPKYAKSKATA